MPNTYSKLYIHIVFAVRFRQNLIAENHRDELQKIMSAIIDNKGFKLYAIYCMPDHVHLLISMKPAQSISDMVKDLKTGSTKFINEHRWIKGKFEWQNGFGAFSVGYSQIDTVVRYILNQKEHHFQKSFKEEYVEFLREHAVDYKDEYLFEWL